MKRQGGYTIIEVTLFLAISAALLLLVAGLQMMVSRQRFQDSMITLRTTIQSEFEEVRSGINPRLGVDSVQGCDTVSGGSAAGASPNCMTIGKLLRFNGNDILINYVVATGTIPGTNSNMTDEQALRSTTDFPLRVVDVPGTMTTDPAVQQQTVRMQAGAEFTNGWTIPDGSITSPQAIKGMAILRSPISGAVLVFAMKDGAVLSDGKLNMITTSAIYNVPMALIVKNAYSGFAGGAVCVDRGQTSTAVRLAIPADPAQFESPTNVEGLRTLCSP